MSVTYREPLCLKVIHKKLLLFEGYPQKNSKVQSHPQKDAFVLMLLTEKILV